MRKTGSFLFFLFSLFFFSLWALSSEVKVKSFVQPQEVYENQSFVWILSVSISQGEDVENPELPPLEGFEILSTSQSSQVQVQWINGKMSRQKTLSYNYRLAPQKVGRFTLPSVSIKVGGKSFSTNLISINVIKGKAPPRPQRSNNPWGSFLGRDRPSFFRGTILKPEDVKLSLPIERKEVFVGEFVRAAWFIQSPQPLVLRELNGFPKLEGFWKEDIYLPLRLQPIKPFPGSEFEYHYLLAHYALYPLEVGELTIDPFEVILQGQQAFLSKQFVKKGKPLVLEVKPLPTEGRPESFSGGVGLFEMEVQLSQGEFSVGKPFTLEMRISGEGHARFISSPKILWPSDIKIYDVKEDVRFFKNGRSEKSFVFYLIPKKEGKLFLPLIEVGFFNPNEKSYYIKRAQLPEILVKAGVRGAGEKSSKAFFEPSPSELSEEPSLYLDWKESRFFIKSQWFLVLWFFSILGFLIWILIRNIGFNSSSQDVLETLSKRLNKVQERLYGDSWRKASVDMLNTIYWYLGRLSLRKGSASREFQELLSTLPLDLQERLSQDLISFMSSWQTLAFAPEDIAQPLRKDKKSLESLFQKTRELLEKTLKREQNLEASD